MIKDQKKYRVAVFIDAANIQIHWRKLLRYLEKFGDITFAGYYTVAPETDKQIAFVNSLKRFGYKIKKKPLKKIHLGNNKYVNKANVDVEIAVDAVLHKDSFDKMVLFSGDSDFSYLIEILHQFYKQTIVVSTRYSVSRELIAMADLFIDLTKIKNDIKRKSPSFATGGKSS